MADVIKTVADPVALVMAAAAVTIPRVIGYKLAYDAMLAEQRRLQAEAARGAQVGPAAPPPQQANPSGATAVNFAERLLREQGL